MSEEKRVIAGRYELGDLLGHGGMGDVYLGTDTLDGEPVAIKALHPYIVRDNPAIVDRFQREGEALRQLDHPNIVKILDTIEEDGDHYLVMEYVSGGSLRDLIEQEGRLPIENILNIALDLADALARAHRMNIIHRDIKPDNVLLAEDGTPRLTDFGVAHLGDRTRLTQTGSVIGTYAYLSPEACNGLELDERADIWAFGVMLYEMLIGRLPFEETGTAALLTAILTKPAPDITRFRSDIPPALTDLLVSMLEKDRGNRISSVRLVGAELEALIRGLDTPLRDLLFGDAAHRGESSRFATPSDQGEGGVPAMARGAPGQTHGLTVYPAQEPGTGAPPGVVTPVGTGEYVVLPTKWKWIAVMVIAVATACSAIVIAALFVSPRDDEKTGPATHEPPSALQATPAPGESAATSPDEIEPVAEGEYMVLVAEMEPLEQDQRDVTRFIVDDLVQALEIGVPFSTVRIRRYPEIITSAEQAKQAAETVGATVIVWGNYSPDVIEVEVQVGVLDAFPYMTFERDVLERTGNVRLHMTDERSESVAPAVLTLIGLLQHADGDSYETLRTGVIQEALDVTPAEIVGNTVAAHLHRASLGGDEDTSPLEYIDAALALDAGNPILYTYRSAINFQLGNFEESRRDAESALRIGPPGWAMPRMLMASLTRDDSVLNIFDEVIAMRPDDWFPLFFRGAIYHESGAYDLARADLDRSMALGPNANFPYIYSALLAMHEGRLEDAAALIMTILVEFPDPNYMQRLIGTTFGEDSPSPYGLVLSAFVNQSLGRHENVLETAALALEYYPDFTDMLAMQGTSQCAVEDYTAAEVSYSQVIDVQPDFAFAYLMRAQIRLALGDTSGAEDDFAAIRAGQQADTVAPFISVIESGDVPCGQFFSPDNPLLYDAMMAVVPPETADQPPSGPLDAETATGTTIEPAKPGEYMVLVAALEPYGGVAERDVSRFIVDDLERVLVEEIPNSNFAIRAYPGYFTSDAEALAAAEAVKATVIVWGNYSDEMIELEVQVGVLDEFAYNTFDRDLLEKTANVRVQMTDERRQSLARYVANVVNLLTVADGDEIRFFLTLATLASFQNDETEIASNTVAAYTHRALIAYAADDPAALDAFTAAIELDSGNAMLYFYRALVSLRSGDITAITTDVETAARLGPEGWTGPLYLSGSFAENEETFLDILTSVIAVRPDDWYPYYGRAMWTYYTSGDLNAALADLDQSIKLGPTTNAPYLIATLIALREGRIIDAQEYTNAILTKFPDPQTIVRAMQALYGGETTEFTSVLFSSGTSLVLGQYDSVIEQLTPMVIELYEAPPDDLANQIKASGDDKQVVDLLLLQGLAYCGLEDHEAADQAFSRALDIDSDYTLLYLLRGQARRSEKWIEHATLDFQKAQAHTLGVEFDPWVKAGITGDWNCRNLFDWQPPQPATPQPDLEPIETPAEETPIVLIEPPDEGKFLVLVARLEALDGVAERDVARFILDDLAERFEGEVPFSSIQVRAYPQVIMSADDAELAAKANNASVIVWGHYSPDDIELHVQLGSTAGFPHIPFAPDVLNTTANVRVRMTNERRESIAVPVVSMLNLLSVADGNVASYGYTMAVIDALAVSGKAGPSVTMSDADVLDVDVAGNTVAAHLHRAILALLGDPSAAVDELAQAIDLDSGNPILYLYRAVAYLLAGQNASAVSDLETAMRLSPDTWLLPEFLLLGDDSDMGTYVDVLQRMINTRPTDWYPFADLGSTYYYWWNDPVLGKVYLEQSIANQPPTSYPYLMAMMLMLHSDNYAAAQDYADTILTEFVDPGMSGRVMRIFGMDDEDSYWMNTIFTAGMDLLLGQHVSAIEELEAVEVMLEQPDMVAQSDDMSMFMSDLFAIQGLVYCDLDEYEQAEAAFDHALESDPGFNLAYLMRGQVRQAQENTGGAAADFEVVQEQVFDTGTTRYIEAAIAGEWTCHNFFDYRPAR
ncbi:MAG: protein kinase [Anaerolineae bacterium]|nr:protein kinase [Anaerolineae bacterium]